MVQPDEPTPHEHPLLKVAREVIVSSSRGERFIDTAGRRRLEAAILDHKASPDLASGIIRLCDFAAALYNAPDAQSAAMTIIAVVGGLKPELSPSLSGIERACAPAHDKVLGNDRETVAPMSLPAPEGALKLSSMTGFQASRSSKRNGVR
jgi:hypothetical protein